ncbi:hypothetical protein [Gordonia sp. 'Campus']|uniref:hypothetical protein n=1 Tax=Gordonia sp. 'Campus' TaxID=2915824 RepID=UPI001EE4C20D|nr:hypothetical protein [Gordonia sp. 'Campus']
MTERVRVAAELSAFNYAARFGYPGRTLGDYLADFGGWDGYVEDPFGTRPWISLRAFDGADLSLFLKLMFIVPEVAGVDFRPLSGDAIILAEYTLPAGTVIARDHPDPYDD